MTQARDISRMAWRRFRPAGLFRRALMTLRPYICPLELVVDEVPEGARVLDIGCGAGLVLAHLAGARNVDGVGVDTSGPAIEAARACIQAGERLRFEHRGPD